MNDRISMKYATMFQFFIDNNIAFAKFCNTKFCSQPIRSKKKFNDFLFSEQYINACKDPETGTVMLGDIVISVDHVRAQAKEYGHSEKREYAFLIVHSMLHLLGYDHMEEEERIQMETRQKELLLQMEIYR